MPPSVRSAEAIPLEDGAVHRLVRDALAHLHDLPYLQTHALARLVETPAARPAATGKALQRLLLETIASFASEHAEGTSGIHALLTARYVEALDVPAVCRALGLSKTEYYR